MRVISWVAVRTEHVLRTTNGATVSKNNCKLITLHTATQVAAHKEDVLERAVVSDTFAFDDGWFVIDLDPGMLIRKTLISTPLSLLLLRL